MACTMLNIERKSSSQKKMKSYWFVKALFIFMCVTASILGLETKDFEFVYSCNNTIKATKYLYVGMYCKVDNEKVKKVVVESDKWGDKEKVTLFNVTSVDYKYEKGILEFKDGEELKTFYNYYIKDNQQTYDVVNLIANNNKCLFEYRHKGKIIKTKPIGCYKAKKDMAVAYLLLIFTGGIGGHRFYIEDIGTGIFFMFTGCVLGFGCLYDLCTFYKKIEEYNKNL